jgi:hypothetical protein
MEAAMLPLRAIEDDDAWMTEGAAPLVRAVTTMAVRMLRELVVRAPAMTTLAEEESALVADPEIREIVVTRGIEVRSPTRLLRWHRRSPDAPVSERPRRA